MKTLLLLVLLPAFTCASPQNNIDKLDKEALEVLNRAKRVIGGENAETGDWPWLVHLKGKIPFYTGWWGWFLDHKYYYCGASIINKRWILTAAHCFKAPGAPSGIMSPKYWHATIGETDSSHSVWDRFVAFFQRQSEPTKKIWYIHGESLIIHPDFNSYDDWKHDLALMRMEKDMPVSDDPDIKQATLPGDWVNDAQWPTDGQTCYMKGWGCTSTGGPLSDVAQQVVMPIVSESQCSRFFGTISATRLCAGFEFKSVGICPGDSGGPLVCKRNDKWVQVGVASFTSRNNPDKTPGVFTRVSHYREWIENHVNHDGPIQKV